MAVFYWIDSFCCRERIHQSDRLIHKLAHESRLSRVRRVNLEYTHEKAVRADEHRIDGMTRDRVALQLLIYRIRSIVRLVHVGHGAQRCLVRFRHRHSRFAPFFFFFK